MTEPAALRARRADEEAAWALVAAGQRRRQQLRAKKGQPAGTISLGQVNRAGRLLADLWDAGRFYGVEPGDWTACLPLMADLVFDVVATCERRRTAAAAAGQSLPQPSGWD